MYTTYTAPYVLYRRRGPSALMQPGRCEARRRKGKSLKNSDRRQAENYRLYRSLGMATLILTTTLFVTLFSLVATPQILSGMKGAQVAVFAIVDVIGIILAGFSLLAEKKESRMVKILASVSFAIAICVLVGLLSFLVSTLIPSLA
jgi:hypothetical protein